MRNLFVEVFDKLGWNHSVMYPLSLSLFLVVFYLLMRQWGIRKYHGSKKLTRSEKHALVKNYKTYLKIILFFSIVAVWFSQVQSLFVSLIAITAALVIATKELIMCLTGGILIRINDSFQISDRIEVADIRGYVLEKNLTTTKLLEMGPEKNSSQTTGNIITLPNSMMLNQHIVNESYFEGFSIKSFSFQLPDKLSFEQFEQSLEKWAKSICDEYIEEAERVLKKIGHKRGISIPSIQPRIKLSLDEDNHIVLILKMPVRNKSIADVEQALIRQYAYLLSEMK